MLEQTNGAMQAMYDGASTRAKWDILTITLHAGVINRTGAAAFSSGQIPPAMTGSVFKSANRVQYGKRLVTLLRTNPDLLQDVLSP